MSDRLHIVQIAPKIGPGAGIQAVAWHLEREFREQGHLVESVTYDTLKTVRTRQHRSVLLRKAGMVWSMVNLSVAGTRRARRFLADRPGAVSIGHSAVMAGDVYVNHGIPFAAMVARGNPVWRMLRNPLQPFTYVRDLIRYRGRTHRRIVALTATEEATLRRVFGKVRPPVEVIPNGVDLDRYRPPSTEERRAARERLGLDEEHRVALFVGHELRWKGLPLVIDALAHAPTVLLLVAGGDSESLPAMRRRAEERGVASRVHFAGVVDDAAPLYAASDMFIFPSLYESYGMVVAEALASGLPVLATPVGCAADLVTDGVNGYLTDRDPRHLADRMETVAMTGVEAWRDACRDSVAHLSWRFVAQKHLEVLSAVVAEREAEQSR